jgi:hypothetical protein
MALLLLALAALGPPPATSSFERAAKKQMEDLPGRPTIWTKETVYRAQASHLQEIT